MAEIHTSFSPEETQAIAQTLISTLTPQTNILCLYGELASGKTTFTQGIGKYFGVHNIISPTYIIAREYSLHHFHFQKLFHIDLYRLEDYHQIRSLDLDEIWGNPSHLVIIEWSERLGKHLPRHHIDVRFKTTDLHHQIIIDRHL